MGSKRPHSAVTGGNTSFFYSAIVRLRTINGIISQTSSKAKVIGQRSRSPRSKI